MKIAMYILFGGAPQVKGVSEWFENDEDYIRVTDIIEVDFIDLPPEVTIPPQLAAIDKGIAVVRAEMGAKIAGLEEQRSKLQAITHTQE